MNKEYTGLLGLSQRLPPTNLPAEQALLGALLANNRAYERVGEFLLPEHFADPINGKIYREISTLVQGNRIADAITLKGIFEHNHTLDEVGGLAYLAKLLSSMVGIISAGEYGSAIYDAWMRRQLIDCGEELVNTSFAPTPEAPGAIEILEQHDVAIQRIAQGNNKNFTVTVQTAVREAVKVAKAAMLRGDALAGITTGYGSLDKMLFGLQPENLIIIGARPSMGKTALALGIAARAAASNKGVRVLSWCGEMSASQLGARLAAGYTGLSTTSVFTGHNWAVPEDAEGRPMPLQMADWLALERATEEAGKLNIKIDTTPGITVSTLRSRARRLKRTSGLDLIVVDYLQLMRASREAQSKGLYAAMTEISRDLMELKNELKIPILAMAQLSRANESREEKAPQLSDLRDSGAIEQDANAVMFVHRPHYYLSRTSLSKRMNESDSEFSDRKSILEHDKLSSFGKAVIMIAKNRNGPTGNVEMQFDDNTTWFRDSLENPHSLAW